MVRWRGSCSQGALSGKGSENWSVMTPWVNFPPQQNWPLPALSSVVPGTTFSADSFNFVAVFFPSKLCLIHLCVSITQCSMSVAVICNYFICNLNWHWTRGCLDFEGVSAVKVAEIIRLPPHRWMITRIHFFYLLVLCTTLCKGIPFVKCTHSYLLFSPAKPSTCAYLTWQLMVALQSRCRGCEKRVTGSIPLALKYIGKMRNLFHNKNVNENHVESHFSSNHWQTLGRLLTLLLRTCKYKPRTNWSNSFWKAIWQYQNYKHMYLLAQQF